MTNESLMVRVDGLWGYTDGEVVAELYNNYIFWPCGETSQLSPDGAGGFSMVLRDGTHTAELLPDMRIKWSNGDIWTQMFTYDELLQQRGPGYSPETCTPASRTPAQAPVAYSQVPVTRSPVAPAARTPLPYSPVPVPRGPPSPVAVSSQCTYPVNSPPVHHHPVPQHAPIHQHYPVPTNVPNVPAQRYFTPAAAKGRGNSPPIQYERFSPPVHHYPYQPPANGAGHHYPYQPPTDGAGHHYPYQPPADGGFPNYDVVYDLPATRTIVHHLPQSHVVEHCYDALSSDDLADNKYGHVTHVAQQQVHHADNTYDHHQTEKHCVQRDLPPVKTVQHHIPSHHQVEHSYEHVTRLQSEQEK